jgi:predicted metal-dependent phosphoesterase TrpH
MGQLRRASLLATFAVVAAIAAVLSAPAGATTTQPYVGSLHEHSGYSDGWPGSTPRTYYNSGRSFGLDFMSGSEHSDNADLPIVASEYCLDPVVVPTCALADTVNPLDSFRKWDATLEQAHTATTPGFTAFRGFEWTSDRFGHINVYFSTNDANAKVDGGYATVDTFYSWLGRAASLGGGSDGLATFNHPGAKSLDDSDPGFNWNDFAYVPAADNHMVGIEVFNDHQDYGAAYYAHALDKGWHLGAVGAEDLGHRYSDDWGGPSWAKTVMLAEDRSAPALKAAMLARRFYAIRRPGISLTFTADGRPMGSRITRTEGKKTKIAATISDPTVRLQLITSGGRVLAQGLGSLSVSPKASAADRYYFVRALDATGSPIAYSSPVWVTALPRSGPDTGEWLAGDLHVHTCFSHDAYCGPNDDNTGPEDFYTLGLNIGQRFLEASARGLDYLAITDHNDVRSSADPDFGSAGVIGIPGYENSLHGHAQMLGATKLYDNGDSSATAVNNAANALRADGGVFQINHPAGTIEQRFDNCSDTGVLDWVYGYDVKPDTIEVWNLSSSVQFAERYWECWLAQGAHIGATGGSDSHWISTMAAQGVGNPTTWVFARDRTPAAILEAIEAEHTTIGRIPPGQGGGPLLLEADANGDGTFESIVGDTVPRGSMMRVRATGAPGGGLVTVRANGQTIVNEAPLGPGGELRFRAPSEKGWVRADLLLAPSAANDAPGCEPNGEFISTCIGDYLVGGITSPIYLSK